MSSNAGHRDYDENLLASAPAATKAQLQGGYNPDLLVEKATPPPSRRNLEAGSTSPVEQADHEPIPPKVPFYRTRKGIIIIAVVTLVVIIAAAVGGGVGARHKKKAVAQQGAAPATSTQTSAQASTQTTEGAASGGGQGADSTIPITATMPPGQTVTTPPGQIPTSTSPGNPAGPGVSSTTPGNEGAAQTPT